MTTPARPQPYELNTVYDLEQFVQHLNPPPKGALVRILKSPSEDPLDCVFSHFTTHQTNPRNPVAFPPEMLLSVYGQRLSDISALATCLATDHSEENLYWNEQDNYAKCRIKILADDYFASIQPRSSLCNLL
jgi:hypothetical protein